MTEIPLLVIALFDLANTTDPIEIAKAKGEQIASSRAFKVGDKVKLDEFGLTQWPNAGVFDVLEVDASDKYGSGFGLLTTLFPNEFIDADYFVFAQLQANRTRHGGQTVKTGQKASVMGLEFQLSCSRWGRFDSGPLHRLEWLQTVLTPGCVASTRRFFHLLNDKDKLTNRTRQRRDATAIATVCLILLLALVPAIIVYEHLVK